MRVLLILAVCFLLVACSPGQGKDMLDSAAVARNSATGKVIEDVYNPNHCLSDSRCGVGRLCVNNTCVAKNQR